MPACGKTRVQRKVEELVLSTLEAKAAAPCKALKRRVCQRARKKLAHMLPQEEFEKVVGRLKGEDTVLEATESVQESHPSPLMPMDPSPQLCMAPMPIIVPLLVPVLARTVMPATRTFTPPLVVQSATPDDTPRTPYGNFEIQATPDGTPRTPHGRFEIQAAKCLHDEEAPKSFYNFIDTDLEVRKQTTGSTESEMSPEPAFEDLDSTSSPSVATATYRGFQRHVTLPMPEIQWSVERTFIHFNTCERPLRRRSKSV